VFEYSSRQQIEGYGQVVDLSGDDASAAHAANALALSARGAAEAWLSQLADDRVHHEWLTAFTGGVWDAVNAAFAHAALDDYAAAAALFGEVAGRVDPGVAWQLALAQDGYHGADWLIEKLHPSPQPTAAELDVLPPQFDPRNMVRAGIEVLSHGLPELPEQLSYLMAIPVAYWTAQHCAVVLFLKFEREGRKYDPRTATVIYARTDTGWTSYSDHQRGTVFLFMNAGGFGYDPIATPSSRPHTRGSVMFASGRAYARPVTPSLPAFIQHGRAAPAVKHIALTQDSKEEIRPLDSHFGAWVVCTEQFSAFQVEGRDADGNVLARISFDPDD
jgi:hypothetical protein